MLGRANLVDGTHYRVIMGFTGSGNTITLNWCLYKDRYHITVRADEGVDFYYDFKDREVLSLEMRESILNAVIK